MEQIILISLILIILGLFSFLFFLYKKLQNLNKEEDKQSLLLLQNQIQQMNQELNQKILDTYKIMSETKVDLSKTLQQQFLKNNEQLTQHSRLIQDIGKQSNKIIAEITEKLTSLDKTNQQVISFSEQLNNLQKVLTNQKKRGNLGEAGLKLVLENILPPTAYELQYKFSDNNIVDAVIKTKNGLIPIDAKFSLDNYQRLIEETDEKNREKFEKDFKIDIKKRIDETAKYIKPNEGTLEFAFMFIPSEAIYYDLLVNGVGGNIKINTRNLIDYAFKEKKVVIVSPTTFAAYLQTVLQGLRALEIEENVKIILSNVEKLAKHLNAYDTFMKKLGDNLNTTVNNFNKAYTEFNKIDKDIVKITGLPKQIQPQLIDAKAIKKQDE